MYGILAFCAMLAAWRQQLSALIAIVMACSLFGLALELYQGSIEGRESTPMDAVSNVFGAALGAGVAYASLPWLQRWASDA